MGAPRFPHAKQLPFAGFNNQFAGQTCYIVGRGRTDFDYRELARISDPIFFINDAVCLDRLATSHTFFFAHDRPLLRWLDGSIKATAILPLNGKIFTGSRNAEFAHAGPLVYYQWPHSNRGDLLRLRRDELALREELFVQLGTIHSLLHFVWFCGFQRAKLIGCDGINPQPSDLVARTIEGYDPRLENRSGISPGWQYDRIRKAQDLLMKIFQIEAIYLGTPAI